METKMIPSNNQALEEGAVNSSIHVGLAGLCENPKDVPCHPVALLLSETLGSQERRCPEYRHIQMVAVGR